MVPNDDIFFNKCSLHSTANLFPRCEKIPVWRRLLPAKSKIPKAVLSQPHTRDTPGLHVGCPLHLQSCPHLLGGCNPLLSLLTGLGWTVSGLGSSRPSSICRSSFIRNPSCVISETLMDMSPYFWVFLGLSGWGILLLQGVQTYGAVKDLCLLPTLSSICSIM